MIFFAGEELNRQGPRAYVEDRFDESTPPYPVYNINLEFLCQKGDSAHWRLDGNFINQIETSPQLNDVLGKAVFEVTGTKLVPMPKDFVGYSDSGSFLTSGIPSTTLSNIGSDKLGTRYMHTSLDNRDRISEERISETVAILKECILIFEQSPAVVK